MRVGTNHGMGCKFLGAQAEFNISTYTYSSPITVTSSRFDAVKVKASHDGHRRDYHEKCIELIEMMQVSILRTGRTITSENCDHGRETWSKVDQAVYEY